MNNAIETHALEKRYAGEAVVRNMNLRVPEGSVYGLIGPNGAGKTTTMKMILGLCKPTGGKVMLLGREMNDANRLSLLRQTGSLIESPACYGHLTARENLEIVAELGGQARHRPRSAHRSAAKRKDAARAPVFAGHAPAAGHCAGAAGRAEDADFG